MKSNSFRNLLFISLALLLISIAGIFSLWNDLNDLKNEIKTLNEGKKVVSQENEALNKKISQYNKDFEIFSDTNFIKVVLNGSPDSPSSKAFVFLNPGSDSLYLRVESLPVPPGYMNYHLWVANAKGWATNAGILNSDPNEKSLQKLKNIEGAKTFLITLEQKKVGKFPDVLRMYAKGSF